MLLPILLALAAPVAGDDAQRYHSLCEQVAADYDSARGGFVVKDGAPIEAAVELAFALGRDQGEPLWIARAHQTVEWTLGLFDSTGGGFFERPSDADPMKTSFDKRTPSNARRLENLLDARANGGGDRLWGVAVRVVDYFDRVLLDARGGFVAGQVGDRELEPEANGYAIHAWLRWAGATAEPHIRDFAWKSLDRVWETCWAADLGMMGLDAFGRPKGVPLLEDQVEMGRAYVLGAHFGGREVDLERARTLGDLLLQHFEDPERGGFSEQATPHGEEGKVHHGRRDFAQNAHAVRFLGELASVTGERKYRDAAERAVETFDKDLEKAKNDAADWALALRSLTRTDLPPRPQWKQPPKPKPEPPRVFRVRRKRR